MINIIDYNHRIEWDNIVKSFKEYDIYYISGYTAAFKIHGDGSPILLYYRGKDIRGICVFMIRDVAELSWATGLSKGIFYDAVTPYGYGGWLLEGDSCKEKIYSFWNEYNNFMKEHHIIDAFTRWSPWIKNQDVLRGFSKIIDLGKTIVMDISSEDIIYNNIKSKDRNAIRKAIKNGITIKHTDDPSKLDEFRIIYNATMNKDNALDYYYFEPEFYKSIVADLKGHWNLFYAIYHEKIIAASIMLFCNGRIHYHLSGSVYKYRNLNATNLILYEAALYGARNNYRILHLGGGVGSGKDSLFNFKKTFNKDPDGELQFSISKDCFDYETYLKLIELRKRTDLSFNADSDYFPTYRA